MGLPRCLQNKNKIKKKVGGTGSVFLGGKCLKCGTDDPPQIFVSSDLLITRKGPPLRFFFSFLLLLLLLPSYKNIKAETR